jgi:hypothetical protein
MKKRKMRRIADIERTLVSVSARCWTNPRQSSRPM